MTPRPTSGGGEARSQPANWRRKLLAGLVVAFIAGGAQWIILCRTRAPEPTTVFPKNVEALNRPKR